MERGALRFDEVVKGVRVQDLIQSLVERAPAGRRQLIGGRMDNEHQGALEPFARVRLTRVADSDR